jgi:rod shape-determining protein MreD
MILVVLSAMVLLVQVSLLPALRPLGVVPDLALVFVVLVGLESTASAAVVLAVVMGLALDLSSGANLGMWTGILVLVALVTGLLHRGGVETGGPLVPVVIITIATLLVPLIVLTALVPVVPHWPVGLLAGRVACEIMLNLILMILVRPVVRRVVPGAAADVAWTRIGEG